MIKNARTWAMGTSLAALGTLSIASVAVGQVWTPPANCFCGPVENCHGIEVEAENTCDYQAGEFCSCVPTLGPNGCILSIAAICTVPSGS